MQSNSPIPADGGSSKKALLYLRVSSEEQVENYSLDTQKDICTKEAERRGYQVVDTFREEGRSAKSILGRPVLIELLEYCRRNKRHLDAVFVYRLDRISRQTADYLAIRKKLAAQGIELISATEPTGNSPTEKLIETMLAGFAQLDNDIRSERATNGLRARFLSGLISGKAPIGYKLVDGFAVKDPETWDKIKQAWDLMATGTKSLREMATIMNQWGLRQKHGKIYKLRPQTTNRIFRQKFYMGIITSNKYPEEVKGQHVPMITKEQFYKVQAILDGRNSHTVKLSRRIVDNPDFPLRRITICTNCGATFTGAWSQGKREKYAYYFCRHRCGKGSERVIDVHKELKLFLQEVTPTTEQLTLFVESLRSEYNRRLKNLQQRKSLAQDEITKLQELRQTLVEKNLLGIYSDDVFKEQNKIIEDKIAAAQTALSDSVISKYDIDEIIKFILDRFSDLGKTYYESTLQQKKSLLCSIVASGLLWGYPGFSNTKLSNMYQSILDFPTLGVPWGAGNGNRTRVSSLEGRYNTIIPYPLEYYIELSRKSYDGEIIFPINP